MTTGFVALWKNNQREYAATAVDEWGTTARIQGAFAAGRSRGIRSFGLYSSRFSSPWQYMTFWIGPNLAAIFDTIADLEQAGDFKFADSLHLVGRCRDDPLWQSEGAWERVPEPAAGAPALLGVVMLQRLPSPRERLAAAAQNLRDWPRVSAELGVCCYGSFACRFSAGWDRFTFWTAPDEAALFAALTWLERNTGPFLTETTMVTGRLDRYFRFGNHLQTEQTWLNEEVPS